MSVRHSHFLESCQPSWQRKDRRLRAQRKGIWWVLYISLLLFLLYVSLCVVCLCVFRKFALYCHDYSDLASGAFGQLSLISVFIKIILTVCVSCEFAPNFNYYLIFYWLCASLLSLRIFLIAVNVLLCRHLLCWLPFFIIIKIMPSVYTWQVVSQVSLLLMLCWLYVSQWICLLFIAIITV